MKITREQFILKANDIHDCKYDYSLVDYKGVDAKVRIICLEHGEFLQSPYNHVNRKQGCPKCANERRSGDRKLTREAFIEKAKKVHGDRYNYDKINYINMKTKVEIVCTAHGSFWQTPLNHLNGNGCPYCSKNSKCTTELFIEEANKVHNHKYDYIKTQYVNNRTKVLITCPEHGDFWQTPLSHIRGHGCPICGKEQQKQTILEKYGTSHYSKTDDFKEKYKSTCLKKYGVTNFSKTPEFARKLRKTCIEKYGAPSYMDSDDFKDGWTLYQKKIVEIKRQNGTLNTSKPQENMHKALLEKFGEEDVLTEYIDVRYPYHCDFYIKSLDLFIELNAHWTHGHHFFNRENVADIKTLSEWQEKAINSAFYKNAIEVWTIKDVQKKDKANAENLNYEVFWDNDLSDFHLWLEKQ